jgi:hypothetical protein
VQRIARHLNDQLVQMPARLAEADERRWNERAWRERRRTVVGLLVMLLGGFLAGQAASYRSGAATTARTSAVEAGTKATKSTPAAPRRPATKPNAFSMR